MLECRAMKRPSPRPANGSAAGLTPAPASSPSGLAATDAAGADAPPPGRIAELVLATAEYVQRALKYPISVDEESLAFVDHYVTQMRGDEGGQTGRGLRGKPDVLRLVAAALGAHLGELAIARFGGRWRTLPAAAGEDKTDAADPAGWRVELDAAPVVFDPIGMAALALDPPDADGEDVSTGDEIEGDAVGFVTRPDLREPLRAALVRSPPVSADYYYSLTGRFETLTYVVELLSEILELKRSKEAGADADAGEDEADDADDAADAADATAASAAVPPAARPAPARRPPRAPN